MNKKSNICCIFNYPSHYRQSIYKKMEDELDCDFYFGDIEEGKVQKLDYSIFNKPIVNLKTIRLIYHLNWIKGSVKLLFKPYKKYILVGEPWCLSTWTILFLSKITSKQVFLWTHGWYGSEGNGKIFLKKLFFGLASGIFLYGDYARNLMIELGFKPNKLHVIYNSLDYEKQFNIRSKLSKRSVFSNYFQNDFPVVMFSGRLTRVKRLDMLLEAQKRLKENGTIINLFMLGDGPEKPLLEVYSKQLGLDKNSWFYGLCYDEEKIGQFFYEADLCVSPGNVGLTAIHALTYGCPVITHGCFPKQMPEFEAIRKGMTGDFFEKDDVESLVHVVTLWLKEYQVKNRGVVEMCFRIIDEKFNPNYQIEVFKKSGL